MSDPNSFIEQSKNISRKFLQSVVAVDDNLVFESREPISADEFDGFDTEEEPSPLGIPDGPPREDDPGTVGLSHKLYYQELSSSFAQRGIICSAFHPLQSQEESIEAINRSSRNADITILDWQMDSESQKNGDLAKASIIKILEDDRDEGGRLRLITIYTSMTSLEDVAADIYKNLKEFSPTIKGCTISFPNSGGVFSHTKIDVISKSVTEVQLHNAVVDSFTRLTAGLLSNTALAAITEIRNRTHNLLHKFNAELDPAYISHVLSLINSKDMRDRAKDVAFDYAAQLISEELNSHIQYSPEVKKALSESVISNWPKYANESNSGDYFILSRFDADSEVSFGNDKMIEYLSITSEDELKQLITEDLKLSKPKKFDSFTKGAPLELSERGGAKRIHDELSYIEAVRVDYNGPNNPIPTLKRGSVVKHSTSGVYYICLQPLCDSIRLNCSTDFVFILAEEVDGKRSFTHVVKTEDKTLIRLKVEPSVKNLRTFKLFHHAEERLIKPEHIDGMFTFHVQGENEDKLDFTLKWVCELKQPTSQSLSNILATSISRVGLDSFEWLRRISNSD